MINEVVHIATAMADGPAEKYFRTICGFDGADPAKKEKINGLIQAGLEVRERIRPMIDIRAVVSSFDDARIDGTSIAAGGVRFSCSAFEQVDPDAVRRVFAFILTVGEMDLASASLIDLFYADAWGTAYADAGRDLLRMELAGSADPGSDEGSDEGRDEGRGRYISDSFGPGFYGMDLQQLEKFFVLLDAGSIGVRLTGSACMLPLKSCAGFYIMTDRPGALPPDGCRSCLSPGKSCSYCRAGAGKAVDEIKK